MSKQQFGLIGLAVMGENLALNILLKTEDTYANARPQTLTVHIN